MTSKTKIPPKTDKSRLFIGILLGVVLAGGVVSFLTSDTKGVRLVPKAPEMITITLPPPPPVTPPPPPPQKEQPPPEKDQMEDIPDEVVDLTPIDEAPVEEPSESLGTNITGNGPDMGLTRGGRIGGPGGRKGGLGGTNKFARYSVSAVAMIEQALRTDPETRSAVIDGLKIEFWPDVNGRITRARIIGASSGSAIDQAVERVLIGLSTPPASDPDGMPPSVKIRINARKSS